MDQRRAHNRPDVLRLAIRVGLLCGLAAACEADREPSPDDGGGGAPDASVAEPPTTPRPVLPPRAPRDPAPPSEVSFAPCPEGWDPTPLADGAPHATICEPFPAGEPGTCAEGERPAPGASGCVSIGDACPTEDPFDPQAPADAVFVMPGADGGDGTRERPFGSIADAVAAATDGAVLALAVGDYDEHVRLDKDLTLRGACTTGARIGPSSESMPALVVEGDARVEALSVQTAGIGVHVDDNGSLDLDGVEVSAGEHALDVAGTVTASDVLIRGAPSRLTAGGSLLAVRTAVVDSAGVGIDVNGGSLELARSAVWNAAGHGITVRARGVATIDETVFWGATERGLHLAGDGAEASLTNVVVRDVARDAGSDSYATSVLVDDGASLTAERLLVDREAQFGLSVQGDGSSATVRGVVVHGPDMPRGSGSCVQVLDGGWLGASDVVLEECSDFGAVVSHASGQLANAWISGPMPRAAGVGGLGLLSTSANLVVRRAVVERAHHVGAAVSDSTGQLALIDVVVRGTQPEVASGEWGAGAVALNGGKLILERVRFEENTGTGLVARDAGASVTGTDIRIRNTRAGHAGALEGIGIGLRLSDDSRIDLARVAVEESEGLGVLAESSARLADLTVVDTHHWDRPPHLGSLWGRGLEVQHGTLELVRAHIESNHADGVMVAGRDAVLEARDLTVLDTLDNGSGLEGRGVLVFLGGAARIDGARVAGNRYIAVSGYGSGTRLELSDLEILDTRAASCAMEDCFPGGIGLGAYESARVRAERFQIVGNALAGVQVADGGQLDLVQGEVRGSPIGANVQDSGYDLQRLSGTVRYVDNERNLDAMSLPVPESGGTVDIATDPGF